MVSCKSCKNNKSPERAAGGIDIEERYCEIAAQRMAQEVLNYIYKNEDVL